MDTCPGQDGQVWWVDSLPWTLSIHVTQPNLRLSLEPTPFPPGVSGVPDGIGGHSSPVSDSGRPLWHSQTAPWGGWGSGERKPPCEALPPPLLACTLSPNPGDTHHSHVQDLLVVSEQFKGLLVVQVGGCQGHSEVDATSVGQDGIFCQGLQSYTGVLQTQRERLPSAPGATWLASPCPEEPEDMGCL
jgi:hypothetical protein